MQIVRILSTPTQDLTRLVDLLRNRGFEVDVVLEDGSVSQESSRIVTELQEFAAGVSTVSASSAELDSSNSPVPIEADTSDWPIWQLLHGQDVLIPANVPSIELTVQRQIESSVSGFDAAGYRAWRRGGEFISEFTAASVLRKTAMLSVSAVVIAFLLNVTGHHLKPLPPKIVQSATESSQPAPFQKATNNENSPLLSTAVGPNGLDGREAGSQATSNFTRSELVAKDTVVRYRPQRLAPALAVPATGPAVKVYSDMKSN